MSAATALADRGRLPTGQTKRQEQFDATLIDSIDFGPMLAQVAIVPMRVDRVCLIGYDGEAEVMAALQGRIEGRALKLEAPIPFEPGSTRSPSNSRDVVGITMTIGNPHSAATPRRLQATPSPSTGARST